MKSSTAALCSSGAVPARSRTEDVDRLIAARIRALRARRGMTLTTLADAAGVSLQQMSKYEAGRNRVSGGRLWRIANALDVEVADLFPAPAPEPAKRLAPRDGAARLPSEP